MAAEFSLHRHLPEVDCTAVAKIKVGDARLALVELRPRQPLPPSGFELRLGFLDRRRWSFMCTLGGLPTTP